jgi:uncharacterized protein (TIGR01777 family)
MKVLISGSTGLLGTALIPELRQQGHSLAGLVRRKSSGDGGLMPEIAWEPGSGAIDFDALHHWGKPDALIHLAGRNIASGRWTTREKREIRESRVTATRLLCESLLNADLAPATFIAASAMGVYGNRCDALLDESSSLGNDFLAKVTQDWEAAATPLEQTGARMVWLRFGMILSARGGAVKKMLPAFKLGIAGKLGSGKQWVSWIHLEDAVRAILFALSQPQIEGAYNAIAPNPVQNSRFTKALGAALHRPTMLPVPAALLKLAFGQVAQDVLLASQKGSPSRLLEAGFKFKHENIQEAFTQIFGGKDQA